MINNDAVEKLRGGLIVSCQAPYSSPLDDPYIISSFALTAELNGAAGVRINSPRHISATKQRVTVPIIGIEKVESDVSEVYITPTFEIASRIAASGAEIIAVDATRRPRPMGEKIEKLIRLIQENLRRPVLADIATFEDGLFAADYGAEIVATTLCGYTTESKGQPLPALDLLEKLAGRLSIPVICEGGVSSPEQVREAFNRGAFAVVVGTAITGVDKLVERFASVSLRFEI
jgi:N-acylglucosamine-6-phosphate 2-epimerase